MIWRFGDFLEERSEAVKCESLYDSGGIADIVEKEETRELTWGHLLKRLPRQELGPAEPASLSD